jgi:hypothetical protein
MYRPILVLLLALTPLWGQVAFEKSADRIDITIDGKPFSAYYFGGEAPKPYLHPLRTATGSLISRRYPMEVVEGETRDHPHHRGLWFTHGDVNGFDFWMNEKSYRNPRKGVIAFKKLVEVKGGPKQGVIRAEFEWQSPDGKPLLTETQVLTFESHPTLRMIHFDSTLAALDTVKFGDTKEGFFAIRLRDDLTERKATAKMTNAEGKSLMKDVWGARSPWVDYSGEAGGEKMGIAILDHPSNPKHPTFWHSRDYGLFAANAFGEHDFLRDKTKDGSLTIERGKSLRFRYLVVIHPGLTADANVPALFSKFAATK